MHTLRRSFWALVGVAILGFGSAVLRVAQVGVDPYTAANIGIFFTEKVNKPLMKKDLAALEGVSAARQDHPLAFLTRRSDVSSRRKCQQDKALGDMPCLVGTKAARKGLR